VGFQGTTRVLQKRYEESKPSKSIVSYILVYSACIGAHVCTQNEKKKTAYRNYTSELRPTPEYGTKTDVRREEN